MKLSDKVLAMQHSPIRKFNPIAQKAKDAGKKVYHLNIGQPDIETPGCFMDAIKNMDEKVIAYAESGGVTVLQDAISDYFRQYGMDYGRDNMIVTNGGSEALSMIFISLLNPGDEVLIPEPFYTNYHTFATMADGVVVPITTTPEEGYHYADAEKIEAAITPKTKAICCISPGNPTGVVLTLDEMKLIGEIAKKHDLWIIADEVYREFAYDGRQVTSFGMLDDLADRVIIVDSVSKRFSACGARIGCVISKNKELMDNLMKIAQGRLCSPTVEQIGAAALYKLPKSYYNEVRAEYEARRDAVYEELMKIPGVVCQKPGGAFYLTAKLPVDDASEFLMFLLTEFDHNGETVMFSPAEGFYATPGLGREEMRIAYVLNKEDMARGVELIRLGIEAYNKR
ncbi:pyridoxal phosphate-dependent aminotransferase [Anaerovorax odorimutans]|uniref:Aminotransferase n=1 Tax=Anaerovorax odorimutans TaxID=109327 RepID=A0ABT1RL07_9FIRM|nr:pyridoxal phosphate-dependent aminotransferase [Anaerovorax odorimutans]MCQ4635878.1 pyridoxal phosphate-dependent aminotransferase [Anaerovorax odorimutans]